MPTPAAGPRRQGTLSIRRHALYDWNVAAQEVRRVMPHAVRSFFGALIALFALLVPGLSHAQTDEDYLLMPGDIVEITVLEDPNLNRRVLVGPDGAITLPLAGSIRAGGKSLAAVQAEVAGRLRGQFVSAPSVTASLVALGQPTGAGPGATVDVGFIYILGQVQRPGRYEYFTEEPINVLQALALAGGAGVFAATSRIQVRERDEEGAEQLRVFDYAAIEDGKDAGAPATLTSGAIIVVPERGLFD